MRKDEVTRGQSVATRIKQFETAIKAITTIKSDTGHHLQSLRRLYIYVVFSFLYSCICICYLIAAHCVLKRVGSGKSFAKEFSPHMVFVFVFSYLYIFVFVLAICICICIHLFAAQCDKSFAKVPIIFRPALQLHHRHIGEDNTSPSSSEIIILTNIFFIFRLFADCVERGSSEDGDQRPVEPEVC